MKTAFAFVAIIGISALQAQAAPSLDQVPLSNIPMSVAKRLVTAPATLDTSTLAVAKTGLPMRVATRTGQPEQALATGNTVVRLSGVRACHAKRT